MGIYEYKNPILAGSLSAIITKTSTAPLSRIKILQQIESYHNIKNYNTFLSGFKQIYKTEGFKGFYKGNSVNIIKSIPTYAIKLPLNDYCIKGLDKKKKIYFFQNF